MNFQTSENMKKLLQMVFSYKKINVVDAKTGKQEEATYFMLFGITLNITYK